MTRCLVGVVGLGFPLRVLLVLWMIPCLSAPVGCDAPDPSVLDVDGDGVPDEFDAFPLDPSEQVDTDGDGVGDNADAFPDDADESVDTDGDGTGDGADSDDDNDGVLDDDDANPLDPEVS